MMQIRVLYHGTNGDNILEILRHGAIKPSADGRIFFSERSFGSVLMHGADSRRRATFAVQLRVSIPDTAALEQTATAGVADTLIVTTTLPLAVQVLELYIREPRSSTVTTIKGAAGIKAYLSTRSATP